MMEWEEKGKRMGVGRQSVRYIREEITEERRGRGGEMWKGVVIGRRGARDKRGRKAGIGRIRIIIDVNSQYKKRK